jgi:hypothetical protein
MTTCADVTDCLLFRHLALFLGGVGLGVHKSAVVARFDARWRTGVTVSNLKHKSMGTRFNENFYHKMVIRSEQRSELDNYNVINK